MAIIHVDGKKYEVNGANNLLAACLSLNLDIPYFCWHPALGSVGSCRQCAVKQYDGEDDKRGRIVMSCMVPATDRTWISIDDEEATKFRQSVVEWLMANHPHDCPVCEEGGHCHLQDMTVMVGHNQRKYRFSKRTHNNQYLGPFIAHEMNRCIACYRCVRFYRDYAGGEDLGVYGAHDNVYFGRVKDGTLESEFAGNLTEVCPTGVFTDKTHSAHYARKWDMQFAPSICHGCSSGCNISPGERYGKIRRIENRFNGAINHYFLCDRGRFGYGYLNDENRPKQPMYKKSQISLDEALDLAGNQMKGLKLIGIGSTRTSLENNHALCNLVGRDNFSTGMTDNESEIMQTLLKLLRNSPLPIASIRDIEQHDAIFVLGEDLTQTAARLALAIRASVQSKGVELAGNLGISSWLDSAVKTIAQKRRNPLFIASTNNTKLDDVAQECFIGTPYELAQLGFAVAHILDEHAPNPHNLTSKLRNFAHKIAQGLLDAKKPLLISGASLGSLDLIEASSNIIKALHTKQKTASISMVVPEVNSLGLALYGGNSIENVLNKVDENSALIIVENDLYRRVPKQILDKAFNQAKLIVVLEHQQTTTTTKADLFLPANSFVECDGTVVSQEGRAQRFFQVYDPCYYDESNNARDSWRWLQALGGVIYDRDLTWSCLEQVTQDCANTNSILNNIVKASSESGFRIKGLKIAREPLRYSGRTAMRSAISVHEPRQPQDDDSPFSFSMEGYSGAKEERKQIPFAWSPGWNSPQAWNKFQDEVGGHLRAGDPGVRLIEPVADNLSWFTPIIKNIASNLEFVPIYHLFGSEENSAKTEEFRQLIPKVYISLNSDEANKLNAKNGDVLSVDLKDIKLYLPLKINEGLSNGVIGLPFGFNDIGSFLFNCNIDNIEVIKGELA